jgi:hypothetical protein
VQIINDQNPQFFLFGALSAVTLTFQRCELLSPCGGRGQDHMNRALAAAFPGTPAVLQGTLGNSSGITYDAFTGIPFQGYTAAPEDASMELLNTTVICYDPPGPFAPLQEPGIWTAGASTATSAQFGLCQRPETLGADYRGKHAAAASGSPCTEWSNGALQVHHL